MTEPAGTLSRRGQPWAIVLAFGLGVFVGGFDQTFIVPVLSSVLRDFDVPVDELGRAAWIVNGYLLGYTIAMPVMGRIADVYGHLKVFVAALLIFMGGSVLVALAPTLPAMAAARALTALGGGALVPIALAVAADALPERQRPVGLSSISVLDDASSLLGPLWGTLIGAWLGWRGLFWLNIALALPVLLVVLVLARSGPGRTRRHVDWTGAAFLTAGLTLLAFALADTSAQPRPLGETVALILLAGGALTLFVRQERRAEEPLVDLTMFRDRRLTIAFAIFMIEGGALITALVNVPLIAEVLWGRTGAGPGLVLMRMVLFMLAGGLLGGLLVSRLGVRLTTTAGLALAVVGLLGMRAWSESPGELSVWLTLAVAGVGFTLSDAALYLVVLEGVDHTRRASTAALLQVFQTTGMLVGMALLASQGLGRFDRQAAELFAASPQGADPERFRTLIHNTFTDTFTVAAAAMLVATILGALLSRRPASGEEPPGSGVEGG